MVLFLSYQKQFTKKSFYPSPTCLINIIIILVIILRPPGQHTDLGVILLERLRVDLELR